jgi:hypothetical protein
LPVAHSLPAVQAWLVFFLQAPVASQVFAPVHSETSSALVTGVQVPGVALQRWHAPAQGVPQHTPSLQIPDEHTIAPSGQSDPSGRGSLE